MTKNTKFKKGKSGNPGGRPKLPENIRKLALEKAPKAFERICELTSDNDQRIAIAACNVVLERAYGRPATERPTIRFNMPTIENTESLLLAMRNILGAVASGDVSPTDAKDVASLIDVHRKAIETTELDQRITTLEEKEK